MTELYNNTIQHFPQDIEELPYSVNVYRYAGKKSLCRFVSLERDRLYRSFRTVQSTRAQSTGSDDVDISPQMEGTQSDHIIFTFEPLIAAHEIQDLLAGFPFHDRLAFDPQNNILVVKMVLPHHEQAAHALDQMLVIALEHMGLSKTILFWGTTTLTSPDGSTKQADGGWSPRRPPRGAPKRPSVVLEVGASETSAKLRRNAYYWVDPARGNANMAITIKMHQTKHQIIIEQWMWNPQISRPIQKSHLTLKETNGKVYFDPDHPTPQLVIPFQSLFRQPAENNREQDVLFATQDLVDFATMVGGMQFEDAKG
ncbi:unnamed protein product [Penicillium salamii]|nr:unnamed protein product [Penicillium salamii]